MIFLRVIELTTGMYGGSGSKVLRLPDDVRCEKRGDCLVLIEPKTKRQHIFNNRGEYVGSERKEGFCLSHQIIAPLIPADVRPKIEGERRQP